MRIGKLIWADGGPDAFADSVAAAERAGLATAWTPQIFGWDALTLLALAATSWGPPSCPYTPAIPSPWQRQP
jgi:alkanesulfonate monooxygenase SsuD/methylene tetrahydromethanopterin reductase-like flavin-dependent oxidoreductase (luciferase family)